MSDFNYKNLTKEQLMWVYENFDFSLNPYRHQLACMAFAADKKRIGIWVDVGCGKTLTSLWIAKQWNCNKILVVCPGSAIGSWARDAKQTKMSYKIISGTTEERRNKINQRQCISICQYESLKTLYCDFAESAGYKIEAKNISLENADFLASKDENRKVIPDKDNPGMYVVVKKKSCKWKINEKLFTQDFDCVIFDEIHRCNSRYTLQSEICLELSKRINYVCGLSGTPVDRCLLELFGIYHVLDLGATFGWNFQSFRQSNFYQKGFDWEIRPGRKEYILKRWAMNSLSFNREECFDLPECQEEILLLQSTDEFKQMEHNIIHGIPLQVKGLNAIFLDPSTKAIKLKQLTDGFIYFNEGRNSRISYRLKENPKLEAVLELTQCGKKIIVFNEFEEVGDMLSEALQKAETKFIRIKGGLEPEERLSLEHQFQNDPDTLAAIVQTSAGSEGWDGFAAEIVIFFDIISSPKIRKQCIGRMVRSGQKKSTLVIELVLEQSINELTKKNQGSRKTIVEEYMDYIQGK